jgi:hypothetical protein
MRESSFFHILVPIFSANPIGEVILTREVGRVALALVLNSNRFVTIADLFAYRTMKAGHRTVVQRP